MKKIENTENAQGAETVPERQPSKLYTIRSFMAIVKKLKKLEMVTAQAQKELDKISTNLLNGYLMGETKPEE